jgi:hypothetical protein
MMPPKAAAPIPSPAAPIPSPAASGNSGGLLNANNPALKSMLSKAANKDAASDDSSGSEGDDDWD